MQKNSIDIFENASVPKAVISNALPAIVSMIMVLVYNLADTFFIGKTGNIYMVNAVSFATPAFLIFMAVGMIFGVGGTSYISRKLGEGDRSIAKKISSFCFWTGFVFGLIFSILVWVFIDKICVLIGARDGENFTYTKSYFSVVSFSLPFLIISNAFANIIRAEGKANVAMAGTILGNVLNIVLDPIMIFTFGWGIKGAAIATVIGNVVSALFYTVHLLSKRSIFSINPKYYAVKSGICSNVLKIGIPASLNSALMSVSQIITNNCLKSIDASGIAVGGFGVALKVNMIVVMLLIGLGTGIQPVLGYCYGARNYKRFNSVMRFSLLLAVILSVVMSLVSLLFANQLVHAFIEDPSQSEYASTFVRILVISGPVLGVLFVMINALQAMGAAVPSLILSMSRQGIIYLPILLIMRYVTNSVDWVVSAQPITDYFAVALSATLFPICLKKFKKDCAAESAEEAVGDRTVN